MKFLLFIFATTLIASSSWAANRNTFVEHNLSCTADIAAVPFRHAKVHYEVNISATEAVVTENNEEPVTSHFNKLQVSDSLNVLTYAENKIGPPVVMLSFTQDKVLTKVALYARGFEGLVLITTLNCP